MDGSKYTAGEETLSTLAGHGRGRFGRIDPRLIAEHIASSTRDADWTLLRSALDALARRYGFAQRDGLALASRKLPRGGVGTYRTISREGRRADARPYDTAILSLAPLRTSCSCPDFVRSSLGLCKHGLIVLEALEEQGVLKRPAAPGFVPRHARSSGIRIIRSSVPPTVSSACA